MMECKSAIEENFFTESDASAFAVHASKCNDILSSVHEGCSPYFTPLQRSKFGIEEDYGGITGTVLPSNISRFARVLITGRLEGETVLPCEFRLRRHESVFLDIGCGTGRPSFYFAKLALKCSLGLDVDSLQVTNSITGHARLQSKRSAAAIEFSCPISFFKQDVKSLVSLGPVTHAYAFAGYTDFAMSIAALALSSPNLRVLFLVVLKREDLRLAGLVDETEAGIFLPGMKMSGGTSYLGVIVPMTEHRRKCIALALQEQGIERPPVGEVECALDLRMQAALSRRWDQTDVLQEDDRPPKRACTKKFIDTSQRRRDLLLISPSKKKTRIQKELIA